MGTLIMERRTGIGPAYSAWEADILPLNYRRTSTWEIILQIADFLKPDTIIFMWINRQRAEELIAWYRKNRRDLPWRRDPSPYHVWLSEIMLQQTRVEFVKERYLRFLEELPDLLSLAECEEEKLMKLWEGMGYYSRARNLQKCARVVADQYGGELPADPHTLKSLPGIGPYTAGAISAIAFHLPSAAVDGNVMRVFARAIADERDIRKEDVKKEYSEMVQSFLDASAASLSETDPLFMPSFTQALMELGALVCLPNGKPVCESCPWKNSCFSHARGLQQLIPVVTKKKARRIEQRTILIVREGERFLMHRRDKRGLLAGLTEFAGAAGYLSRKEALRYVTDLGLEPLKISPLPEAKHIFTHVEWHMKAYEILVSASERDTGQGLFWADKKELHHTAVPSAFRTYLEYYDLR